MKIADKKALAESLYIKSSLNRKEIAQQIGVTEKTLRNWIEANDWDSIKDSQTITRKQLLLDSYQQLKAVNDEIRLNHNNIPNKQLSDAKGVLIKEIEALNSQPIHKYVEVFEDYIQYLYKYAPDLVKGFAEHSLKFIEQLGKRN